MTTLACRAEEYFSSIGPLAKKIQNDQENFRLRYGEEKWLKLTTEQQEHLLDKFFVDEATQEKYAKDGEDGEERPECFPKLMIPCGEKICVDFDNDQGWTWRDEHSGPFSWKTRSQQDLALFDEEDEGIGDDSSDTNKNGASNKSTPVGTPKRPVRKAKKSQSPRPEPKGSLAFKPEKSIWDSPFLAADRGLDSAYPSSHSSDQSKGSDESDHGDMINKFGMAAAFSDAVRQAERAERNSMSACSDDTQPDLEEQKSPRKLDPSPERVEPSPRLDVGFENRASPSRESISSTSSSKSGKKKSGSKSSTKDKRWRPSRSEKKTEAEQSLMSELSVSMGSSSIGEPHGQVSPVFIEDPGESSSDFNSSINSNSKFLFSDVLSKTRESLPPPPPPPKTKPRPEPSSDREWSLPTSGTPTVVESGKVNPLAEAESTREDLDNWHVDLFSPSKVTDRLLEDTVITQEPFSHNKVTDRLLEDTTTSQDSSHNDDSTAPKTGFDFLDNW